MALKQIPVFKRRRFSELSPNYDQYAEKKLARFPLAPAELNEGALNQLAKLDLFLYQNAIEKRKRYEANPDIERTFHVLKELWLEETLTASSVTDMTTNLNYQYIIGLGPSVVPLLLKDLEESQNHWFWALMVITRENPIEEDDEGDIELMTEAWLAWGRNRGIV